MTKTKILTCVLALLCAVSCKKDKNPSTLSGTQWETTIQQVYVLLSFTNNNNGTLRITDPNQGINEKVDFTYTYNDPNVKLTPTNPEYANSYPNGIKAVVYGDQIDFSDFFKDIYPEGIALTRKRK